MLTLIVVGNFLGEQVNVIKDVFGDLQEPRTVSEYIYLIVQIYLMCDSLFPLN